MAPLPLRLQIAQRTPAARPDQAHPLRVRCGSTSIVCLGRICRDVGACIDCCLVARHVHYFLRAETVCVGVCVCVQLRNVVKLPTALAPPCSLVRRNSFTVSCDKVFRVPAGNDSL